MGKEVFKPWVTMNEIFGFAKRTDSTAKYDAIHQDFCKRVVDTALGDKSRPGALTGEQLNRSTRNSYIECYWHSLGRPHYKVWPGVAESLAETSMQFAGEHFRPPYSCFSVMFPEGMFGVPNCLVYCPTRDVAISHSEAIRKFVDIHPDKLEKGVTREQMLAMADLTEAREKASAETYGKRVLDLVFLWYDSDKTHIEYVIPIHEGEEIEERVVTIPDPNHDEMPIATNRKEQESMIRIAVGVAMLAVNKHELVAPDLNKEEIEKRFPLSRGKAGNAARNAQIERTYAKNTGWIVGGNIDLPRRGQHSSGGTGEGQELRYSHVRSGHMRMQVHGPRNSLRKLIFVAPAFVRPDLPVGKTHGYEVKDSVSV
jgi:hypothetical protein